jgi:hypothetical protein
MRELVREFVAQAWVGDKLAIAVALVAFYERCNQCLLVVHCRSLAQNPG